MGYTVKLLIYFIVNKYMTYTSQNITDVISDMYFNVRYLLVLFVLIVFTVCHVFFSYR